MKSNLRPLISWVLVALMAIVAFVSIFRVLTKGKSSTDFHPYWYAGQFIWQGTDFYGPMLAKKDPMLPIHYLDGPTVITGPVYQPSLSNTAALTAPIVLLLALLSRLSWNTASTLWLIINILLIIINSYLVIYLLNKRYLYLNWLLLTTILASLIATRSVLENGQVSLFILLLMLVAMIIGQKHEYIAGICLGFALSKYSLAFPIVLLFIFNRLYRGVFMSIIVQIAGIFSLAAITKISPLQVIYEYIQMFLLHTNQPGMQLSSSLLGNYGSLATIIVCLLSVIIIIILYLWYKNIYRGHKLDLQVVNVLLFIILMEWNLLTFYHRIHDHVVEILFIAVILPMVGTSRQIFPLSRHQTSTIIVITSILVGVWILPIYLLTGQAVYVTIYSLGSMLALTISLWLLFKLPEQNSLA